MSSTSSGVLHSRAPGPLEDVRVHAEADGRLVVRGGDEQRAVRHHRHAPHRRRVQVGEEDEAVVVRPVRVQVLQQAGHQRALLGHPVLLAQPLVGLVEDLLDSALKGRMLRTRVTGKRSTCTPSTFASCSSPGGKTFSQVRWSFAQRGEHGQVPVRRELLHHLLRVALGAARHLAVALHHDAHPGLLRRRRRAALRALALAQRLREGPLRSPRRRSPSAAAPGPRARARAATGPRTAPPPARRGRRSASGRRRCPRPRASRAPPPPRRPAPAPPRPWPRRSGTPKPSCSLMETKTFAAAVRRHQLRVVQPPEEVHPGQPARRALERLEVAAARLVAAHHQQARVGPQAQQLRVQREQVLEALVRHHPAHR